MGYLIQERAGNFKCITHGDIEAFEQREEALKLRAKLEAAEQGRLAGAPAYTLEDSRKRLEEIYRRG